MARAARCGRRRTPTAHPSCEPDGRTMANLCAARARVTLYPRAWGGFDLARRPAGDEPRAPAGPATRGRACGCMSCALPGAGGGGAAIRSSGSGRTEVTSDFGRPWRFPARWIRLDGSARFQPGPGFASPAVATDLLSGLQELAEALSTQRTAPHLRGDGGGDGPLGADDR